MVLVLDCLSRGKPVSSLFLYQVTLHSVRERDGVVVERWTLNLEVLGSVPKGVTVLCP